ncbi:hypothetical protein M758_8G182800, partial [Ceratodon purpureus]
LQESPLPNFRFPLKECSSSGFTNKSNLSTNLEIRPNAILLMSRSHLSRILGHLDLIPQKHTTTITPHLNITQSHTTTSKPPVKSKARHRPKINTPVTPAPSQHTYDSSHGTWHACMQASRKP